jgi:hypothetical protein
MQPVQDLEISGPLGGVATGDVLLHNPQGEAAELSFSAGRFVGPDGVTSVSPVVSPPECSLPPGAEKLITIIANLDNDAFAPGAHYTANVAIIGVEVVVRVRLTVLPA